MLGRVQFLKTRDVDDCRVFERRDFRKSKESKMESFPDVTIAAQNEYQFETEDAAGKITAGSLELAVSALKMTFGDDVSGWIVTENGDRNAIGRLGGQN